MSKPILYGLLEPLARRFRGRRGNAAIEIGLMAPFLLLMLVGIADYGSATYVEMQVQNAAQAGAQYAVENNASGFNYTTATAVESAVTSATALSGLTASPVPAVSCGCASGNSITAPSPTGCPANSSTSGSICVMPSSCTGSCTASCTSKCGSLTAGLYVTVSAQGSYTTIVPYPGIPSSFSFTRQSTVRIK